MDEDHLRDRPWGFLLTIGGLAAVGIAILVVPGILAPDVTGPSPRPSPSPDPHLVFTDTETIAFGFEEGAIVVHRTTGGVVSELGRVAVPEAMWPTESGAPLGGAAAFATSAIMVCPGPGSEAQERFIFGSLGFGTGIKYTGPAAVGQGAPDGLFLFALAPGEIDPATRITVESRSGQIGILARAFDDALTSGDKQRSGCRVDE